MSAPGAANQPIEQEPDFKPEPATPDMAEILAECADAVERAGYLDQAHLWREQASRIWSDLGRKRSPPPP